MTDTNVVILTGRATRDAELKYVASGAAVASFGLAVNRSYKRGDEWVEEEPTFVDITAWATLAQRISSVKKGDPVLVTGRLKTDRWQNAEGATKTKLYVVAERITRIAKETPREE